MARGGSARQAERPASSTLWWMRYRANLASNGFAPFPKNKLSKLLSNIEETKSLMANGQ
eukprot:jgi/Botrbrau1/21699/Bobra.43_1s0095.1